MTKLNVFDLYYCSICGIAAMQEHPEDKRLVKCGFCGYTADQDKHIKDLKKRYKKQTLKRRKK